MKYLVVLGALLGLASAQSPSQMKLLVRLHSECKAVTGVNDALATGVMAGKFPDDETLKKHLLCIYKKSGFMGDDGHIQKDVTQVIYETALKDEAKAEQLVDICAVEKDTPENTAFEMSKCVWDNTKGVV
ncbi:unnamed protein product [Callosobruchus maculatus]|uniref:Uncharacterized protein n=1 Tax=Callosobruchus maculatus TaxID=64391 RepID=A0A653CNQ8_CALMS|nr:unnamed protein product [Callosobruchus maculatus]